MQNIQKKSKKVTKLLAITLALVMMLGVLPLASINVIAEEPVVCVDCKALECMCHRLHVGRVGDIRMIRNPVAGEFPSSAYLNPSRDNGNGNGHANGFHTTFTWEPAVEHYFLPDTEYTVTILLEPNDRWGTASGSATSNLLPGSTAAARNAGFLGAGITPRNFGMGTANNYAGTGQPRYTSLYDIPGVKNIDWEYGRSPSTAGSSTMQGNISIHITYEATGPEINEATLVFNDDFTGQTNPLNLTQGVTTAFVRAPQHNNRQGMDSWRWTQSTIVNRDYATGGRALRLGLLHNPSLADQHAWSRPPSPYIRNNWIEAGAVRTRTTDNNSTPFEHAFGHYEARVKFPAINATWGAFWLMYSNGASQRGIRSARVGSEIDLIETAANPFGSYNAASHWNSYSYDHADPTNHLFGRNGPSNNRNVNWTPLDEYFRQIGDVYDGEWHTFAVQWTPTDYIFYINDIEWARRSRAETYQWGGSTDPNVDEGWGWGGLIGPHMLNDPRHFAGVAENPNYIKLSVEAADWSGLGMDGPGLATPCPAGSCDDCTYISDRDDTTFGLGWHRVTSGEMLVDWVKVWNGPKPVSAMDGAADYSNVNEAVAKAEAIDSRQYEDMSGVDAAISDVVWGLRSNYQVRINKYADAILAAIDALVYIDDATFIGARAADVVKFGIPQSNLLLSANNNATLTLVLDGREIVLATRVNNRNVAGEIDLGDGFFLKVDIKGNGSNIKVFEIIKK